MLVRTAVLVVLLIGAAIVCSPGAPFVVALYLIADALLVNTAYVFVNASALNPLRSSVLTFVAYIHIALGFAVGWLWFVPETRWVERVTRAVYESVRTLTTAGPEWKPAGWGGRLFVVAELLVGIYFVVVVLTIYASWARKERAS